jgi:hypothetical protein
MKANRIGLAMIAALSAVSAAWAQHDPCDFYVELYDSYGSTGGGEFRAQITQKIVDLAHPYPNPSMPHINPLRTGTNFQGSTYGPPLAYTSPVATHAAPGKFEVFCLEKHEFLANPLGNMDAATGAFRYQADVADHTVAQSADYGGNAHGGFNDPLDEMTAYLYKKFITKTLTGYDWSDSTGVGGAGESARINSANALQQAIWYIEQEEDYDDPSVPGIVVGSYDPHILSDASSRLTSAALAFYTLAYNAVYGGGWSGYHGVQVMNLFLSSSRREFQSQLIQMVPLPSQATLAGAGLLGLLGLGVVRRRTVR